MLRILQAIGDYKKTHISLYRLSLVVLFWSLADSVFAFSIPVIMNKALNNLSLVGMILGTSSIFGLLVDFWLGSDQKKRSYKNYYIVTFTIAALAYIVALQASVVLGFVLVMAMWGIYYDLNNFAIMDFIKVFSRSYERSRTWGVIQTFGSLGYLLGPLLAGTVVLTGRLGLTIALCLMTTSFLLFQFWFMRGEKSLGIVLSKEPLAKELKIWIFVIKKAKMVFWSRFILYVWDSLIWSMGAIMVTGMFGSKGSLLIACFLVPSVFLEGLAGYWADKKGKKKFVIAGLVLAGIFMSLFSLATSFWLKACFALLSAVGAAMVWPAVDGLFIDTIGNLDKVKEEVSAVRGAAANLAYITTPMLGGYLGSLFGLPAVFLFTGLLVSFFAIIIGLCWINKN